MSTRCRQCGFDNPPEMKFCGNCGVRLEVPNSEERALSPGAKTEVQALGVMVGADLLERFRKAGLEAHGQRRAVTVLFVDISGFTRLSSQLGDEETYELIQRFIRGLAEDVYRYQGMVDKLTGDGLMALFGAPIAFENNAERAVHSAQDMLSTVARLSQATPALKGQPLNVHIGLNAGSVIVGGLGSDVLMNYTAIGDSVNLARRLEEIAVPGTILVSNSVYRQVHRLFDFQPVPDLVLKGYDEPVMAYQVMGGKKRPGSVRGVEGLRAPMIGRETELSRLLALVERLSDDRQGALVLLTAEGGMGKSRLTAELLARIDPLRVHALEGQSLTYRKSIPYWIFQDVIRNWIGSDQELLPEDLRGRLAAAVNELQIGQAEELLTYLDLLMGFEATPAQAERIQYLEAGQLRQRIFLAVRDLLIAISRKKALLLVLEDLHWADDASLDLLLFILDCVRSEAIILYVISRPFEGSAVERIAERAQQRLASRYISIRLQALQPDQTNLLLASLLSITNLPETLREQIITRAAGLPFYLEEILRMLIEDGILYREAEAWYFKPGADSNLIRVPDSLQGLILARFDRLDPAQRRVIQTAAVIGDRFKLPVIFEVLADLQDVRQILAVLCEREFLLPDAGGDTDTFSFKNTLIADAVYSTLLLRDRRETHTQVGLAIERIYSVRLEGQVEILASHFLRSPLIDRALRYLILAGQKAAHAYALTQARTLFSQAEAILPQVEHSLDQELDVHEALGDTHVTSGEYPEALDHYSTALALLRDGKNGKLLVRRSTLERKIANGLERQGNYDEALAHLDQAERILEEHPGEAPIEQSRILNDTGWIWFRRGDLDQAEKLLTRALELAEPIRQYDVIASIFNRLGGICFQRDRTDQARDFVQRSLQLREKIGDIVAVARTYNNLGLLDWKQGNWQAALDNFNRAYQFQVNLGDVEAMIELESNLGLLQIDRGFFGEAEKHLQAALDRSRQIGHSYQLGLAYLHLTLLSVTTEDWRRALDYGGQSLELFNNIGVREHLLGLYSILGLAWLGQENLEKAEEAARLAEAVYSELGGDASGRVDDYARLVFLLAEIAGARSENEQAAQLYQRSVTLFEQTGDRLQCGRSLVRLGEVFARSGRIGEAREWFSQARLILERAGSSHDLQRLDELAARM